MLPDGSYCRKHSAVPFDSQDTFMQQPPHIPAAAAGVPKERSYWLKDLTEKAALGVKHFCACTSRPFHDDWRRC